MRTATLCIVEISCTIKSFESLEIVTCHIHVCRVCMLTPGFQRFDGCPDNTAISTVKNHIHDDKN